MKNLKALVFLDGIGFPEGPRWHDGKLWFSDMESHQVISVDSDASTEVITEVPNKPSGLGWLPDNRLLVVSMLDGRLLRLVITEGSESSLTEVADISPLASFNCNDMVVDHAGRAYIGNFGYDAADPDAVARLADLVMVTPEGDSSSVATDLAFPNGMVITPDNKTLIVAESLACRLTAFDIASDGSLSNRRIWAQLDNKGFEGFFNPDRIFPDGIALDAQGGIWMATPTGCGQVLRINEGGEITHSVDVSNDPFAVILGGDDRKTLFICTAIFGESPSTHGRIEAVQVDIPGAGYP